MFLVPLFVGVTVLVVAMASRREMDRTVESRRADEALEPAPIIRRDNAVPRHPLTDAFPQLRLWVPEHDTIYRQTCKPEGAAGPDIVIRTLSDAA